MKLGSSALWLGALVCALVAFVHAQAPVSANERPYRVDAGVRLSPRMRRVLTDLGRRFRAETGHSLRVTSGTRSARQQAAAMLYKLERGEALTRTYRDREGATEIQRAYDRHRRHGRAACVRAMTRVIRRQVARGRFISNHLRASAVDISSRSMSARDRRAFLRIVRARRDVRLLYEGTPPHFHLHLR